MAVDRTKILEAAQKHLSKGAYDKAIVELQKLVKADPSDVRTWLKIGDLYVKLNQRPQAIDTYARVADQYAGQGFFHKAVAVYKQILNLDGTRLDVKLRLAEMHESMQLTSDAMAAYEQIAAEYGRLGDADKALSTFGKMVGLDATNIPTRIKYAEALSRAGRNEEAAAAFEAGAELLKKQGRMDDYLKVVERLLFHREDVDRSRELAELYLERNDGKRALAKLQVLFKADPKHIPTLELLARAFEQVQQLPKTISVLREIARLYGDKGMVDERARALKRIVALDPGDPEARQALAQMAGPARPQAAIQKDLAPPPGAVIASTRSQRALSEPPEELEDDAYDDTADEPDEVIAYVDEDADAVVIAPEDDDVDEVVPYAVSAGTSAAPQALEDDESSDVFIVEEDPIDEAAAESQHEAQHGSHDAAHDGAHEVAEPPARPSLPPDVAREANIAKLMTEVEVFLRYGLKQKVVEQLRTVLTIDPRHVEAREKLKDLLVERGETAAAAVELMALADQFVGEKPSVTLLYLRQARDLDPGNPDILQRLASLETHSQRPPARAATPAPAMPTPMPATPAPAGYAPEASEQNAPEETTAERAHEPLSPPTRPQPVTSYLAQRGPKVAGQTGANAALDASGKPIAAAPVGRPALGAPLGSPLGRAPARPLGAPLGSALGARPSPISAPKPGGAKPFASPLGRSPMRSDGEPRTGEIALPPAVRAATPAPAVRAPTPAPRVPTPPPPPRAPTPAHTDADDEGGFFEDERTVFGGAMFAAQNPDDGHDAQVDDLPDDPFAVGEDREGLPPAEPSVEAPAQFAEEQEPEGIDAAAAAHSTSPPTGDPLAPMSAAEFDSVPLRPSTVEESGPGRPSLPPGEVEEILDEAEFFVAQGLFEEGVGVLRDALAAHPKNRLLADRIAEIEEQAARTNAAMKDASQPPPAIDNSFELAEKLADELGQNTREGSDVLDVEEVFAQFKRGVEAQVAPDDTNTHFDLGIAYKEMGLLPDAIHEFELCIASQSRECESHTMIGLCHLEKNDVTAAISAFKKGLYSERKSDREELGLYFELGRAYETMRDPQEALYYYEKVKKRDDKFLNVQDRIDALTRGRPTSEAAPGEDLDAAFDELMGKD